jgi:AcrR family transcriptional regulator
MEKSKTEIKLLESARKLFWKYGLKRVTVEEICQNAAVSKMSFYRFFKNKLAIAKEVLNLEIEENLDEYRDLLKSSLEFVEKMEAIIHLKLKHSDKIGSEFLQDIMTHGGKEFHQFLMEKQNETADMVMDFLEKGQENGDIRKDLNLKLIPFLSEYLTLMVSNDRLLQMYDAPKDLIKEITTFFFYGMVSHPKHP